MHRFFRIHTASLCPLGGLLALGVVTQWLTLNCLADYLPSVGPAPLRFQVAAVPALAAEPQQATGIIGATNISSAAPTTTNEAPTGGMLSPDSVLLEARSPDPLSPFELFPPMAPLSHGGAESSFITPQMMLQFFERRNGGTNSINTGVLGSVLFSPPRPATNATSKAAYSTP